MYRMLILLVLFFPAYVAVAEVHTDKYIGTIVPVTDSRDCALFTLVDVPVADSTMGIADPIDAQWFSIPTTHFGYRVIMDILLSSKLSNRTISVGTRSIQTNLNCGFAEVSSVTQD